MASGTEFTLEAGDAAAFPPLADGEVRNDDRESASVVVMAIVPPGTATPAAATPEP